VVRRDGTLNIRIIVIPAKAGIQKKERKEHRLTAAFLFAGHFTRRHLDNPVETAMVVRSWVARREVSMPKKDKNAIEVLVDAMKGHVQDLMDTQDRRHAIIDDLRQAEKRLLRMIKKESRIVLKAHNAAKEVSYECVGCTWDPCDPDEEPFRVVMEIGYLRRKSDGTCIDDTSPESDEPAVRAELKMLQRKLRKRLALMMIVRLRPMEMQVDPPGFY